MLHKMNPVRVGFVRERVMRARQDEGESDESIGLGLSGIHALDVGCGGGLLSEVSRFYQSLVSSRSWVLESSEIRSAYNGD